MSNQTTITITDDSGISVTISEVGIQGPQGPALIWIGPTAPDPDVFPLWLDTST